MTARDVSWYRPGNSDLTAANKHRRERKQRVEAMHRRCRRDKRRLLELLRWGGGR